MKNISLIVSVLLLGSLLPSYGQDFPQMDGYVDSQRRGDAYVARMSYGKALSAYEKGLERSPEDKSLLLSAAQTSYTLGNTESAEVYYGKVISSESSAADILAYSEVLASNGKYDAADKWLGVYQGKVAQDELAERRKSGFNNVAVFYEDSLAYYVEEVPFNTASSEFGAVYFEGGIAFLSDRSAGRKVLEARDSRDGSPFLDLFLYKDGATNSVGPLNNALNQGPMAFLDDNTLIVTVNYPESVKNADKEAVTRLRMLIYERSGTSWKEGSSFPLNNKSYSVGHPSYDRAGGYLYFASDMPGGAGSVDIYRVKYQDGSWGEAENMRSINTAGREAFPFYNNKYGELYFSSDGYAGLGGLDIYKTTAAQPGVFNPGYPVNSAQDDFGVVLDDTGRKGFLSSNREGGKGKDDIYGLTIERVHVEVQLVDAVTGAPLEGSVTVTDVVTGQRLPATVSNGVVSFEGVAERKYRIEGTKEGYSGNAIEMVADREESGLLSIPVKPMALQESEVKESVVVAREPLAVVKVGNLSGEMLYQVGADQHIEAASASDLPTGIATVGLQNVYFRFDSDVISAGEGELAKLADLLVRYEKLQVKVIAYSDAYGTEAYNEGLAARRVARVVGYLTTSGIAGSRISTLAVGDKQLLNDCPELDTCTKEEHQQNRRVEFELSSEQ